MPAIPYVRATHSDGQSWSAAKANLLEAGVNDVSYAPAVRVYHNANQSATSGTPLALALNSERFDQAGNAADTMHDNSTNNSRLTARYAGVYAMSGCAEFAANATGFRQLYIRHSVGSAIIASTLVPTASGTVNSTLSVGALYAFAVNDYVELVALQNSGGGLNILASANYSPEFMMVRVA